ncbi:MAG TPA: mannosyltransferase family protein [Casimicrobiaceae bacterium]|nr:mannosyltransferase family protein [Casimicrobiaceae bacterium]
MRRPSLEVRCGAVFLAAGLVYLLVRLKYLGLRDLLPWDDGWYNSITLWGYISDGGYASEQNVAFFPLHAYAVRYFAALVPIPVWAAQIAVSILFSVAGAMLLAHVMRRHLAPRYVLMGSFLIAFSPFAIFLYNGYSESAYFFATALLLHSVVGRVHPALGVIAVLIASLTRPWGIITGIILAICLAWRWLERPADRALSPNLVVLATCLAALAFIGITFYFQYAFGDPLMFLHGATVWNVQPTTSLQWGVLTANGLGFALGYFRETPFHSMAVGATLYLAGIVVFLLARRWLPREVSVFVAAHALAFYFMIYWSTHGVLNAGRYSLLLYPAAFFALIVFQRIDQVLRPQPAQAAAEPTGARPAFIAEPLPTLGYVVAIAFVALYLRYATDFVNVRWVS